MLPRSKLTIFQSKQSQFAEYLPYLQAIDKKCFRKSDRLVSLCMEELRKKSNSLFIAISSDGKDAICGYLLYSHTKIESSGRILKVSDWWSKRTRLDEARRDKTRQERARERERGSCYHPEHICMTVYCTSSLQCIPIFRVRRLAPTF